MPADLRNGNNPWRSVYGPGAHTWGYRARSNPARPEIKLPRGKVVRKILPAGDAWVSVFIFFRVTE